uniref:Reverse transcriptase domain-containing protein n=1 Tax=Aegilops tauschii subsp. strangulata TaxID=200361 RepID=A0A452YZB4_AEGTS
LGSVDECAFSINKSLLRGDSFDLSELEAPFTEEEIWRAVRSLPTSKAPGPDGFMAEFLRACSDIIKH